MSENNPIVIPDAAGAPRVNIPHHPDTPAEKLAAREVGRELAEARINSRANVGERTAEEWRAMDDDDDTDSELEDTPITDSCDVVRYASIFCEVFSLEFFTMALLVRFSKSITPAIQIILFLAFLMIIVTISTSFHTNASTVPSTHQIFRYIP